MLFFMIVIHQDYVFGDTHHVTSAEVLVSDSLLASYDLNGNVLDATGTHHGTVYGAEYTTDRFSSTVSAFRFDGNDDYIDLGSDFTDTVDSLGVSLWLYPFTTCEPSDTLSIDVAEDQYFLSSGGKFESAGVYAIWNKGALLVGQSLADRHSSHEYHAFLDDGQWHHVYMFFDAAEEVITVHVNGIHMFSLDYVSGSSSTASDLLYIGKPNFIGSEGFHGKVDDIKFYNRKLSDTAISELYQEGCPDSLVFDHLHIQSDTNLYAKFLIRCDSLVIDTACDLNFTTPLVHVVDTSYLSPVSNMTIRSMKGCEQSQSVHDQHFTHRGVYINNFMSDGLLGNELKEDSLIDWCIHQEFNNMYLYNIGSILSSGMQAELDSFVHKVNNQSIDVTFVSAGFGTSFDNIVDYHKNYSHIPQGIVSEIEFWNASMHYDEDYAPWLARLDSLKFTTLSGYDMPLNTALKRRFYIGKIKNPGEPPSDSIAEDLLVHHDEIFLTNYHSNGYHLSTSSSENSIRNKLSVLATAAKRRKQEVDVVILFNVRQDSPAPNIWNYFSQDGEDHDFRAGFELWYHDFLNATDIDHKEYINVKGYGVYRWTDAKVARTGMD